MYLRTSVNLVIEMNHQYQDYLESSECQDFDGRVLVADKISVKVCKCWKLSI